MSEKTPKNLIYPSAIANCRKKHQQISLWMLWPNIVSWVMTKQAAAPACHWNLSREEMPLPCLLLHPRPLVYIPVTKQALLSTSQIPSFSWSIYFPGTCSASLPSLLCLKCLCHVGSTQGPVFFPCSSAAAGAWISAQRHFYPLPHPPHPCLSCLTQI